MERPSSSGGEDGSLCPREDNHTKNSTLFSDCPMLTIIGMTFWKKEFNWTKTD